jgi:hypothetical protein
MAGRVGPRAAVRPRGQAEARRGWTMRVLVPHRGSDGVQRRPAQTRPEHGTSARSGRHAIRWWETPACRRTPPCGPARRPDLRAAREPSGRRFAGENARLAQCPGRGPASRVRTRLGLRAQGRAGGDRPRRRPKAQTAVPSGSGRRARRLDRGEAACRTTLASARTSEGPHHWSPAARDQGTSSVRTCRVCGTVLAGKRSDAVYCGPPCRAEGSRLRRLRQGRPVDGYRTLREYGARQRRTDLSRRTPPSVDVT